MSRKKPSKEILRQVEAEIEGHLSAMEAILLRLSESPGAAEDLSELFRSMHTIKGVGGVLEKPGLVELAHRAENSLSEIREQARPVSEAELEALLQTKDALEKILRGEPVDAAGLFLKSPQPSEPENAQSVESEDDGCAEPMFVVFRVRGRLCAFSAERIAEVSQILPWRQIPFSHESLCGMASLRGQLVPVIDPGPVLDLAGHRPEFGRILFLEVGEELVGVLVDRVLGVYPLPGWQSSSAALRHFGLELVEAVASFRDEGVVAILSADLLFDLASS